MRVLLNTYTRVSQIMQLCAYLPTSQLTKRPLTRRHKKDKEAPVILKLCKTLFRKAGHKGTYSFQSNYNLTDE